MSSPDHTDLSEANAQLFSRIKRLRSDIKLLRHDFDQMSAKFDDSYDASMEQLGRQERLIEEIRQSIRQIREEINRPS